MSETLREELNRLRREKESPKDELLRLRREQGAIDTSPFPLPETPRLTPMQSAQARITNFAMPSPTAEERELAGRGIDITTGAPAGRTQLGFAQNEAQKVKALERSLSEYYKQPITVRSTDDGLMFVNPETNRMTLVDEKNLSLRDFQDIAGPAIPATLATVGAVGGSFLGLPSVGAGVGGAIGEGLRRYAGSRMDVRDETPEEAFQGSVGVGVAEGLFNRAGDLGVAGYQRTRDFFKEPPISKDVAERALRDMQTNVFMANEIAERTGQPFSPFTGQMSLDPTLMGHQRQALDNQFMGAKLRAQNIQNEMTLESFFDELNPPRMAPDSAVGRGIQNEARAQTRPRVEAAQDSVEANIRRLEELTAEIPNATNTVIVRDLNRQLAVSRRILKDIEDEAWTNARNVMGVNPDTALGNVKVPIDGKLATTLNRLTAEANEALDPAIASGKRTLVPEGIQPLRQSVIVDRGGQPFRLTNEADLNQIQVHLSALRRRQRLAKQGQVATDPQGRDLSRIEADIVRQRNAYLKDTNPELLAQIEEAERLTARRADLYDKGVAATLLRKQGGEWTLTDRQVINTVLNSGDREAMEHLVSAMSNHPAGIPTLQRAFLQNYRNEVIEGNVPNAVLHDRFIRRNEDAIDVLFPNDRRIVQLGEFEKVVTAKIKRFENFEKAVNRSFRGKLQNLAPERVAEDIFLKRFSQKDVGRLMALAEGAGLKEQYQAAITEQLRQRFYIKNEGLNLVSMGRFVEKHKDKLIRALGDRWYRDMQLLMRGMQVNRITEAGIRATRDPTLFGALTEAGARLTFARPLSPQGVGLTKMLRFRQNTAEHLMAKAIEDPKALRMIVANANKDIRSRNVGRVLATLGGTSLAIGYFDEVPDYLLEQPATQDEGEQ